MKLLISPTSNAYHPEKKDQTLQNDICILHFNADLPLDKNRNMACLPNPFDEPSPGSECYIAGYGYTGTSFVSCEKVPFSRS